MTAASWPHDLSRRNSVPAWREPHADLQMFSSGPFGLAAQDLILGRKAGAPSLASCLDSESATARTRPRVAGTCCLLRPCATLWAGAPRAFYHSRMLDLAAADPPSRGLDACPDPNTWRDPAAEWNSAPNEHQMWRTFPPPRCPPSLKRPTAHTCWIRRISCCCSFIIWQCVSQVPALRM